MHQPIPSVGVLDLEERGTDGEAVVDAEVLDEGGLDAGLPGIVLVGLAALPEGDYKRMVAYEEGSTYHNNEYQHQQSSTGTPVGSKAGTPAGEETGYFAGVARGLAGGVAGLTVGVWEEGFQIESSIDCMYSIFWLQSFKLLMACEPLTGLGRTVKIKRTATLMGMNGRRQKRNRS